jgi:hypothetical protein
MFNCYYNKIPNIYVDFLSSMTFYNLIWISGKEVGSFFSTYKKMCEMLIGHELHNASSL